MQHAADTFAPLRRNLIRVAYRMLGSVADAEDIVQDAFLRWAGIDRDAVREPEPFLRRMVTRLCLDRLKSARHRRETYVGVWLPEPVMQDPEEDLDDLTLPLMLALERLTPLERAAFLLHDVFGADFEEVAVTIGRDSAACRQLASRARTHIRSARPRFQVSKEHGLAIARAFFAATRGGDMETLRSLLAADVTVYADGGGKVPTSAHPISGIDSVLQLHKSLHQIFVRSMSQLLRFGFIGGLPGFVTIEQGTTLQITALQFQQDNITDIYVMRNPEKLQHIARPPV
jgi:RNA polymerase sigma-70 factor (ECF subfamily)